MTCLLHTLCVRRPEVLQSLLRDDKSPEQLYLAVFFFVEQGVEHGIMVFEFGSSPFQFVVYV